MKKARETKRQTTQKVTIAVRVPAALRRFYEERAESERRRLSDTLRIALEDRAKQLSEAEAV